MHNPRQVAYEALLKIEKNGAYSNIALDFMLSKTDLDTRDKAFVSNLFYGVTERKITLDYQIERYLSKPLRKSKAELLTLLRLGTYQILFMDKVPSSAAVNECVNAAKKNGMTYASGMINAVLRKIDKNGLILPADEDSTEYLSVKYSCPEWLVNKWIKEYGRENTIGILSHALGTNEIYIRVNSTLTDSDKLIDTFSQEGITAEKTSIEDCLRIVLGGKAVESLESYKKGLFHVQDAACQLCSQALGAKEGDRVFDLCAAPGGKTYTIAELMKDKGEVLSFDIHPHRAELIRKGAERLSLCSVKAEVGDATVYNEKLGRADVVLCDVPCSGLGIIGKKPEIKYKNPDDIKQLPSLQLTILRNGAEYVKEGGRLVYSTCTLSKSENEKVCRRFLENNGDFFVVTPLKDFSDDEFVTLLPHMHNTDGFFIACFERKKQNEG